jgi:hypothetical protein
MSCATRHSRDDILLGEPLCPDCYDYTGSVLFNACAPELWRRFAITPHSGPPDRAHQQGTRRPGPGLIRQGRRIPEARRHPLPRHHPARCPAGPTTAPPAWATLALLTAAIDQAARTVHLDIPAASDLPARTLAWGRELDTRPITATGELTDSRVAAYVAKYATKAAECTGTLDRRVTPADRLADLPIREHARRLIAECLRLSKLPDLEGLRLAAWAHMLGFRGHFSTKSRTYSITFSALRADRAAYQREQAVAAGLMPDLASDSTLVLAQWNFAGRGHLLTTPPGPPDPSPGDQRDGSHREGVDDVA